MSRTITVGIDVGTSVTRTVVLSWQKGALAPDILASTAVPTRGLRHGYIVSIPDAALSIRKCIDLAEKEAGVSIRQAVFATSGASLSSETSLGSAIISKSDGEVTAFDIRTALQNAEEALDLKNKRVVSSTPISWKLDGKEVQGKPEGLVGIKLEVRILAVTSYAQHIDDLLSAASEAGVEVLDVIPAPLAASAVALSDRQKAVGVLLANIGAETVSIAVFENNALIGLSVFQIGSTDITNDIALGFRIPLEEAESIKTGSIMATNYPKRKIDEIIEARLSDIFELIDGYLKKIKRSGLLPAGIVITGGGAGLSLVEGLAKDLLRLPSRLGTSDLPANVKGPVRDASWFVAYGLALMAKEGDGGKTRTKPIGAKGIFKEFLRQFLP